MNDPTPGQTREGGVARRAIRVSVRARWLSIVLSGAMFAVASVAVLRGTDGLAVLGFVVVGGVFAFLSVIGVVPTKMQSGDQTFELFDEQIDAVVDVISFDQLQEASRRVTLPSSQPSLLLADLAAFASLARSNLVAACDAIGARVEFDSGIAIHGRVSERRFDAIVSDKDASVVVEVRLRSTTNSFMYELLPLLDHSGAEGLIISGAAADEDPVIRATPGGRRYLLVANRREAIYAGLSALLK